MTLAQWAIRTIHLCLPRMKIHSRRWPPDVRQGYREEGRGNTCPVGQEVSSWPPGLKCPAVSDCNISNREKHLSKTALAVEDIFVYFHHSHGGDVDIQFLHSKFRSASSECAPELFIPDKGSQF